MILVSLALQIKCIKCMPIYVIFTAPTDFTVTNARSKVITFISPINKIYHALFIKNPSETYNYAAYTEPMHWLAWVSLLVFIAVVPPILFITAR